MAQTVKCLSTMQETWVRSLGQEDPLEKEMAIHSRTVAWKIPRTEEPGRLQSMGLQRDGNTRPPDLPLEKPVCRSGSNSQNWTWDNRLVPNRKRSMSRLYIVTLLI